MLIIGCYRRPLRFMALVITAAVMLTTTTEAQQTHPAAQPAREQYIPVDQLDVLFERDRKGVLMSRAEFSELLKQAEQNRLAASEQPAPMVTESVSISVRPADQQALIQMQLQIRQFAAGWQVQRLPIGNLLVEKAEIEGLPAASVARDPQHAQTLLFAHETPGTFVLTLQLSTPLASIGSDRSAAFQLPQMPSTQLEVVCPAGQQLLVNDLKLNRPTADDMEAQYSVPMGAAEQVRLMWTPIGLQQEAETLVFVRTDAQLQVQKEALRWQSDSTISVFGSTINQIAARVPSRMEITSVESTGLESWKLEDDPDQSGFTRLVLSWRQPFTNDRPVQIQGISTLTGTEAQPVPTLEFVDVTAHSGRLIVTHEDGLRLMSETGSGIRPVSDETSKASSTVSVFDFWLQRFELSLAVRPRDRQLFAELVSSLTIRDTSVQLDSKITVETLNGPLFDLSLTLPAEWQLTAVASGGTALDWQSADDGDRILVKPPAAIPTGGLFELQLTLVRTIPDPETEQRLVLPVVIPGDTTIAGGSYSVQFADDLDVSAISLIGLQPAGGSGSQLLFLNLGTELSGELAIRRKVVRLASRSVLRTWADTRQQTLLAEITIDVLRGTTRTLTVRLPENLGAEVHFAISASGSVPGLEARHVPQPVRIVEQSALDVADGMRPFLIRLDRRFSGSLTLLTTVQRSRIADALIDAPAVVVDTAVRQQGVLVFEAYPEQQLKADQDVSQIDGLFVADAGLADAPLSGTGRRVALIYRFVQTGYRFAVSEARFDTEAVPMAIVESIRNVCTLNDDGSVQRLCQTVFRASSVQTLRFRLPDADSSFLWATILNDEPIEVRRDGEDYLVAIPVDGNGQRQSLEVLFESTADQTGPFGKTEQRPLQFWIDLSDKSVSPVDILEQTWDVRYPQTSLLVDSEGHFRPVTGIDQPGWFRSAFQPGLPNLEELPRLLLPLAIFLLVLFVVTALVIQRRWKTLISTGVLSAVLLLVLSSLTLRSRVALEYAARRSTTAAPDDLFRDTNSINPADVANFDFEGAATSSPSGMGGMPGVAGVGGGMADMGEPTMRLREPVSEETLAMPMGGDSIAAHEFQQRFAAPAPSGYPGQPATTPAPVQLGITVPQAAGDRLLATEEQIQQQAIDLPAVQAAASVRAKKGGARLSVRADLEVPDDYQSREFRSVGDAVFAPESLRVIVQRQEQVAALRLVAAILVALLLWGSRNCSMTCRLSLVILLLLGPAGAMPLVSNRWQSVLDGIILGTLGGSFLWILVAALGAFRRICRKGCCQNLSWPWKSSRSQVSSTAALMILVLSASTAMAQPIQTSGVPDRVLHPEVVVPYAADESVLNADRIFIKHDQFLELYRAANPGELSATTSSPIGSTVVAAFYRADQLQPVADGRQVLSIAARYVLFSDSDQSIEIPLPLGPSGVRSVQLDGQDAILKPVHSDVIPHPAEGHASNESPSQQAVPSVQQFSAGNIAPPNSIQQGGLGAAVPAGPAYAIVVHSRGLHVVDLKFDVNAQLDAAAAPANSIGRVDIHLLPVAAGTLEFTLPQDQLEVRVNGRTGTFRRDGKKVIIPVAAMNQLRVQWQPATKNAASETVFHSTATSSLTLLDTGLSLRADLKLNIRQGDLSELDVVLPEQYSVQSVVGKDLAGWSVQNVDDSRLLRIQFRRAVNDETNVQLRLYSERQFAKDQPSLAVPVLMVRGATRDLGTALLLAGPQFQVRSESLSGVTQINPQETPLPEGEGVSGRRLLAWRYTRHPAMISVRVTQTAEELKVAALHAMRLETERQLWTSQLTVQISGSPRSRIDIELPKSFLTLDVRAADLSDWYIANDGSDDSTADGDAAVIDPEDTKILSIQLRSAREGQISIVIQGQLDRDTDRTVLRMQVPQVLDATAMVSQLAVWLDDASENAGVNSGDWTVRAPNDADGRYRTLISTTPGVVFSSNVVRPGLVTLRLRQAVPTLIAESVTVTSTTDTSIEMTLALTWQVTRAAAETFSVEVPTVLADGLIFDVPNQRRLLREELENGRTRLTFRLQQPVRDRLFVLGTGSLPLPDEGTVQTEAPVFFADTDAASLAGQSHFWVLVNQSSGLLQTSGDQKKHEVATSQITTSIPKELLEQSVTVQRLVAETPSWQLTFPKQHQVAPAVVTLASHVTVLSDDGSWRSRHQLQVRNESRQFLPVVIPDGSRLLYCVVQGLPTRIVQQNADGVERHLIPIPQSGAIAAAFDVEFALAGAFSGSVAEIRRQWQSDRLTIPVPEFPEFRDDPDFGISISRNRWSVYVPDSWSTRLVVDPRFTNVVPADEQDFADATLLSQVEQTSTLLNSLKSATDSVSRRKLGRALAEQQQLLGSIRGNSATTESERSSVLSQLQRTDVLDALSESERAAGAPLDPFGNTTDAFGVNSTSNLFLYEQDVNQNSFNYRQGLFFLQGNRAEGQEQSSDNAPKSDRFFFVLPETDEPQAAKKDAESRPESKSVPAPGTAGKPTERRESADDESGRPSGTQRGGQQSQLLQRRQQAGGPQADKLWRQLDAADTKQRSSAETEVILNEGRTMQLSDEAAGLLFPSAEPNVQNPRDIQVDSESGQSVAIPARVISAGMLSLRFDVPTDGVRLDFIRTGGNPGLTFDVRSEQAVSKGAGLLWAIGCGVAALLLLSAGRRLSASAFTLRLSLLVAVASLIGTMVLNEQFRDLSLLICGSSAVVCAVFSVVTSRRSR